MKKKWSILVLLYLMGTLVSAQDSRRQIGILILGSADLPTLDARVNTGYKLYSTMPSIDYIIVSGGCNAHDSGICEATEMKNRLLQQGVPSNLVHKEERSQSTFQNYCYSRKLKDENGQLIIKPGDSLFVVSNHWHAIPVAARFRRDDKVNAQYFIVGEIAPKAADMVNYGNLYSEKASDCICDKIAKE